jgi:hypothetical protein
MAMMAMILAAALAAQTEIKVQSEVPVYTVILPAGYEATTPRENPPRYFRSYGRDFWYRVSVTFVHGAGPLKQNPRGISAEEVLPFVTLPPDSTRTFFTVKWKDLDVGVVEYRATVKDIPVVGLSVVLPLRGNALTMTVFGPTPLEKETRAEFKEILSRITNTTTSWFTDEDFRKMETYDTIGKAGLGLLALYPIAWVIFLRGNVMRAHWLRVAWFVAVAILLFLPITSPGPTTMVNNLIVNALLPIAMISFVVRRIKIGIDEE